MLIMEKAGCPWFLLMLGDGTILPSETQKAALCAGLSLEAVQELFRV
jgi:hypothetical protein